ncbi:hypothetical protein Y037_3754 [Burkholderia pseudomallei MSHR983]|nr:hypothetical protein BDL_5141 [Burkholderia pseudomallei MSHR305]AHK67713.1 hypothetical protein BBX_4307 [Burkholderia pseudomallei MSHR520]AIP19050.1 hypothetical protein DP63_3724 [Burkholderia pseudomallei MSHR5855]AIP43372.1 hypothetical protein DP65_5593 [Burkholderia pseudomallei MSHR5848]AIP84176.1 hypothetical protein JE55_3625 [Burkholderia pseudomallei]KGU60601.1 hypothetical protein Y037_3754 [Burkholderia pseudomallei MSHR983]KGW59972.1 hypothetical protein Y029_6184 [Burkhold
MLSQLLLQCGDRTSQRIDLALILAESINRRLQNVRVVQLLPPQLFERLSDLL